jgi:hypothetical protein
MSSTLRIQEHAQPQPQTEAAKEMAELRDIDASAAAMGRSPASRFRCIYAGIRTSTRLASWAESTPRAS